MNRFALEQHTCALISLGESVVVERPTAITFEDGKPVTSVDESFRVNASVQPVSGRELQITPEGDRMKEQVWVYTDTVLLANDIVTHRGVRFQVQSIEKWPGYVRARGVRIDVGEHAAP
jgi:hypothetical protein